MSKDMASRALGVVAAVLAVVLAVGVFTFAGACVHDDGTTSVCHTAQIAIAVAALLAAALSLPAILAANRKAAGASALAAAACGVFAALAPGAVFPLCMMATMRCHLVMQPFAQFMGIAIAAVSLVAGIRLLRSRA